jgi:hypothetical protein
MDELDEERSSGQVLAAASAAAGLLGALALALTRPRNAAGEEPEGEAAPRKAAAGTGTDFQQVVDQVAEVAPDLVAALDQHAPDVARKLRSKLPLVRAFGGGALADAVEFGRAPRRPSRGFGIRAAGNAGEQAEGIKDRVAEAAEDVKEAAGKAADSIDLSSLTAAQRAAAQAAIAAVSKAENAFGGSERLAGAAESLTPMLRDVAQQAAVHALDLWQSARSRSESALQEGAETVRQEAAGIRRAARDAGDDAADFANAAIERAREEADAARVRAEEAEAAIRELREAASREAEPVVEAAAEAVGVERKQGSVAGKLMWVAALSGAAFYVLMDEERRRTVTVQAREMMRDLRGYDDEF